MEFLSLFEKIVETTALISLQEREQTRRTSSWVSWPHSSTSSKVRESGISWSRWFWGHSGLRQVNHTEYQQVPRYSEVRPMSVISAMVNVEFFRPKSEADDRILTLSLDGNQDIWPSMPRSSVMWSHGGLELGQCQHVWMDRMALMESPGLEENNICSFTF